MPHNPPGHSLGRIPMLAALLMVSAWRRIRCCPSDAGGSAVPVLSVPVCPYITAFCRVSPHEPIEFSNSRCGTSVLVHKGLEALQGRDANLLRGRLRLERHLFLGEGIDALTRLRGGLLDDFHFQESRQREQTVATEALLDDPVERLEHCGDLLTGQPGVLADLIHDV